MSASLPAVPGMPPLTPEPRDLRSRLIAALDSANHTHPCPVTGSKFWTGCYHPDGSGSSGLTCHSERRADAVLGVIGKDIAAQEQRIVDLEAELAELRESYAELASRPSWTQAADVADDVASRLRHHNRPVEADGADAVAKALREKDGTPAASPTRAAVFAEAAEVVYAASVRAEQRAAVWPLTPVRALEDAAEELRARAEAERGGRRD